MLTNTHPIADSLPIKIKTLPIKTLVAKLWQTEMDKHSYMYHNNHCHIHYIIIAQQHQVAPSCWINSLKPRRQSSWHNYQIFLQKEGGSLVRFQTTLSGEYVQFFVKNRPDHEIKPAMHKGHDRARLWKLNPLNDQDHLSAKNELLKNLLPHVVLPKCHYKN